MYTILLSITTENCSTTEAATTEFSWVLPICIVVLSTFTSIVVSLISLRCNMNIKLKQFRIENVTKQRINDFLEIKRISAEICTMTEIQVIKRIKGDIDLQKLILESKKMDFLFKMKYEQDRQVIEIKNALIDSVQNYLDSKNDVDIDNIRLYNKLFSKIVELFTYTSWQLIKQQVKKGIINSTDEFCLIFFDKKVRANYLSEDDETLITNILKNTDSQKTTRKI